MANPEGWDPRTDQLAKGLDAVSTLILGITTDVKNTIAELYRLHSELQVLQYRLGEYDRIFQHGDTMPVRLSNMEKAIAKMDRWVEEQGRIEAETKKILANVEVEREKAEQARSKVEDENSKRRWGFYTAIGTSIVGIIMNIVQWWMKQS